MKLKSCPFCGGTNVRVEQDGCSVCGVRHWYITHTTKNNDCPLADLFDVFRSSAKYTTKEKAIAAWNRRVGDDLVERMEDDGR